VATGRAPEGPEDPLVHNWDSDQGSYAVALEIVENGVGVEAPADDNRGAEH
jgi:hypothetical protein